MKAKMVRIKWEEGKIACCSQLCTDDCPCYEKCEEQLIAVYPTRPPAELAP